MPAALGRWSNWLIGGLLFVVLVLIVEQAVGWRQLLAPWRELSAGLLLWLFVLTAASYGLRAVRVRDYFGLRDRFTPVLRLTLLHNAANNLLPMRLGELVFPWLMRRYFGYGLVVAAASLLWLRVLDLHFLVLLGFLILELSHSSWIWWVGGGLWLGGLGVLIPISKLGESAVLVGSGRLRGPIRQFLQSTPRNPWSILRLYVWTALIWGLKFIAFTSLLRFFLPIETWRLLVGVMGAELSSVLPVHGIAGTGSYELAAVAALVPLGIEPRLALAAAVHLHLFLLGSTLVLGALGLLLPAPQSPLTGNDGHSAD
ncbi:lysylphosphatidylglycerol synthase transmembrane domain-containing protein [Caldichromatium japonicum]|uniref:lysylphosphatidylglycerol synthase transmembrane domain-containing protein n=1 Tax=Caldichromatium japonicum TaxID=2699430 RepID=UPI001FE5BAF0|nr:lysylphosphatidylglycerol synthase transmembrane domain-containing protein [Caldichromatium japonicum]